MANYSEIKKFDTANGEGIRITIFFTGCQFKCKGCFNSNIWDFNKGKWFDSKVYENEIKPAISKYISGISILGGEPLHDKNIAAVAALTRWFKNDFPDKNIWLWSGYTYEDLMAQLSWNQIRAKNVEEVLNNIDILVDGQFIEEQRDLTLAWRGSSNQRVIDVQESLKKGEVVTHGD